MTASRQPSTSSTYLARKARPKASAGVRERLPFANHFAPVMTCRSPLALGLLAAAAALPLAPLHAQQAGQAEPADDPPAAAADPGDAQEAPSREPVTIAAPPAPEAPAATAETPSPARRTAPATPRAGGGTTVVVVPAPAQTGAYVPPPASSVDASVPARGSALPSPGYEPSPYVSPTETPEVLPEPAPVATDTLVRTEQTGRARSPLLWMLFGALAALLLAGLALLLRGRRRHAYAVEHRHARTHYPDPAPAPRAAPPAPAPVPPPAPEPVAAAIPFAAAAEPARPWIALTLRPIRAGITGSDARVEFELALENEGAAPATEVRVSAAMFPAGAPASEMERLLVEGAGEGALPPTSIAPGAGKKITAAIEIPTAEVEGDSLLPVIAAEARYRLPAGGEGRTVASFAIGVPDGDGLARFAVAGSTGLHEDVVAHPFGAAEKA